MLLHGFQAYQHAPHGLWREIHGTYAAVVKGGGHDIALDKDRPPGLVAGTTAHHLYKKLLLLAISGPYRMQHGELARVKKVLDGWASRVLLVPLSQMEQSKGLFVVDTQADGPPKYCCLVEKEKPVHGWVLDTTQLAEYLTEEYAEHGGPERGQYIADALGRFQEIPSDLMQRLMLAWGMAVTRQHQRHRSGGEMLLSSGVDSLFTLFGGEDLDPGGGSSEKARTAGERYVITGGVERLRLGKGGARRAPPRADSEDVVADVPVKVCRILNERDTGYQLAWRGAQGFLHVGEIVALKPPSSPKQLGVVRCLREDVDRLVNMGVELLRGRVVPGVLHQDRMEGEVSHHRV
ncbi:MAG: hypothetical protein AB2813_11620 [Candidatus Sedimenticola endophacoides]